MSIEDTPAKQRREQLIPNSDLGRLFSALFGIRTKVETQSNTRAAIQAPDQIMVVETATPQPISLEKFEELLSPRILEAQLLPKMRIVRFPVPIDPEDLGKGYKREQQSGYVLYGFEVTRHFPALSAGVLGETIYMSPTEPTVEIDVDSPSGAWVFTFQLVEPKERCIGKLRFVAFEPHPGYVHQPIAHKGQDFPSTPEPISHQPVKQARPHTGGKRWDREKEATAIRLTSADADSHIRREYEGSLPFWQAIENNPELLSSGERFLRRLSKELDYQSQPSRIDYVIGQLRMAIPICQKYREGETAVFNMRVRDVALQVMKLMLLQAPDDGSETYVQEVFERLSPITDSLFASDSKPTANTNDTYKQQHDFELGESIYHLVSSCGGYEDDRTVEAFERLFTLWINEYRRQDQQYTLLMRTLARITAVVALLGAVLQDPSTDTYPSRREVIKGAAQVAKELLAKITKQAN